MPSSVACPLFHFDSLWQACDMNTNALIHNVTCSMRMIEWQEDTSLIPEWPLVFTAYNREWGLKPVTIEYFSNLQDIYVEWLDLVFTLSPFQSEYYDNNPNNNFFRMINESTMTVTFPAHSQFTHTFLFHWCSYVTPLMQHYRALTAVYDSLTQSYFFNFVHHLN
jgi:hypothetical protein